MRDRAWLQSFLRLGARAGILSVPEGDIVRQEDTVLRALSMLEAQPGVILADEVGMGKTYEALGLIAARHYEDPSRRALVLTPGPDLTTKWRKEFASFCDPSIAMYRGFAGIFDEARTLREVLQAFAKPDNRIVIAPVTMFAGARSERDNVYLLSIYLHWKGLRGNQAAAVFDRYRSGRLSRVDVTSAAFLDEVAWERIEPLLDLVMRGPGGESPVGIDRAFEEHRYELFVDQRNVDKLLAEIRFRIMRELLPELDLLVIDEAHKLKNSESLRAKAVRRAFDRKFTKALFLTATPFQLDVSELRQVLLLFARARDAGEEVATGADQLLLDIRAYQDAYGAFERAWQRLDGDAAVTFGRTYEADPELIVDVEDPGLRVVVANARRLFDLKRNRIEPGFRRWMIRSLREDKRQYRKHVRPRLEAKAGDAVPFLIYERFIAELFRVKSPTHKAAVQINMVSSYKAAREGALLSDETKSGITGDAERYRALLRALLDGMRDDGGHPKLAFVVKDAIEAAERGEKTLIFCARVATLEELRRQLRDVWLERLVGRWARVYEDASPETIFDSHEEEDRVRGRHSKLQLRFQRTQDALYLALRERYLHTVVDIGTFGVEHADTIVARANEVLSTQRVSRTRAERFDWALAKRCVEHAAAIEWRDRGAPSPDEQDEIGHLTDPRFVPFGYDLTPDDLEADEQGDRSPEWTINVDAALLVLRPDLHLWSYLKAPLHAVAPDARVRATERLARYLTKKEVPFLADLLTAAKNAGLDVEEIHSLPMLEFIDRFWRTPEGRPWCDLLRRFLGHLTKLDTIRREELLDGAIAAGEFVRHTKEGESRERLREAFNTPLYPMVLVANEVMQEGLDLHHQCARVIHHDLAWNPAQLEQRVGRVDRLGSLLHRKRAKDASATLDVLHPLVARTIDVRLDRVVRARERWLEFLLGAPPDLQEYGLADESVPELPERFSEALRIDLGPR